jgi:hypothetical protein
VTTILRQLPFYEDQSSLRIHGGPAVTIRHHQIDLWVSLSRPGLPSLPPSARRFPAVLDPGFNDTFLIQERHFTDWAALALAEYQALGFLSVHGRRVPLLDADLWLHPNRPGYRDQMASKAPFRVELGTGIGVCPLPLDSPRLPLLGLLGLRRADLQLFLDCRRCRVELKTVRRFWFFGE